MNQGQEEHRRPSERWDRVPIKLLRPVGKRAMNEGVHAAATRLVWQRREYIRVGYCQGMHSQETGGSGGGCGSIFHGKNATQNPNVCQRTAMTERQLPEHSGRSVSTTRTACLEGCLAGTSCVCPAALLSAIAGNQPCCGG